MDETAEDGLSEWMKEREYTCIKRSKAIVNIANNKTRRKKERKKRRRDKMEELDEELNG